MPRHPHVFRRGNNLYYRRRIPTDLVEAKAYGKKREFKDSLKTTHFGEANTRANARDVILNEEFAQKRRELVARSKNGSSLATGRERSLTTLSSHERKEFVLRWFVAQEHDAEKERRKYSAPGLEPERDEFINNVRDDLGAYNCSFGDQDFWERHFETWLAEQGVKFEPGEAAEEMQDLWKRGLVESGRRTLSHVEGRPSAEFDGMFKGVSGDSIPLSDGSASHITLGELCDKFMEHRRESNARPSTLKSYNYPIQILNDLFSLSRPVASFAYEDGEKLLRFLRTIPVHAGKHYPRQSLMDTAKRASENSKHAVLSPKRQSDLFTAIRGIFAYAEGRRWLTANPFGGKLLPQRLPTVNESKRVQMTGEELTRLLSSQVFLKERTRKGRSGEPHEGRFWAVLLLLLHGLRANEAAQLFVSDVKEEGKIAFLDVAETDDSGKTVKHLKTKESKRRVPLHKDILEIGFLDFVKAQRERDPSGRLFPEFKPNNIGNYAASLSKWFSRTRDKIFGRQAKMGDKSLHSFRHGVTDAVRRVSESDEIRYALCGHSDGERRNSGFDYGTGYPLKTLKEIVDQIEFPGLDLSFLYASESGNLAV